MDLLQELIDHKDNLDDFVRKLPCGVHINATDDFRVLYLDPRFAHFFGSDQRDDFDQALKDLSDVHPEDLEKAKKSCRYYLDHIDEFSTVSFLQRLKYYDGTYHRYYTTGMLVEELGGLLHFSVDVERALAQEHDLDQIIDEVDFIKTHFELFSRLTKKEMDMVRLWASNHTMSDMAKQLKITQSTIKTYKKRIYKKLEINSFVELHRYAAAFDLI